MGAIRRTRVSEASVTQLANQDAAQGAGKRVHSGAPSRPPSDAPPFTVADLRKAIPKHCFERSYARSFGHVAEDLALVALLALVAWLFETTLPLLPPTAATVARFVVYPVWTYAIGTVLTGLWVLAHECGHQAFSPSTLVNDTVGLILHSALLVPYHSWRISHGKHHSNTGSVENDEVFVPATRDEVEHSSFADSPILHALQIANMLLLGWPAYLIFNLSGPSKYRGLTNSHFLPSAALFSPRDFWLVVLSDAALLVMAAVLVTAHITFGHANVLLYYWAPYLVVNYHLVLITYLQHTDVYIPHYDSSEWDWLRGALATVDRSFGKLLDTRLHRIADLHVCHHIFSRMPFYHHEEATAAMRPILGQYYLQDHTPLASALWRSWTQCKFVQKEGTAPGLWYANSK